MARFLGRQGVHIHSHSGQHPCGDCEAGHPIGRRAAKRRERREIQRELPTPDTEDR